MAGYSKAKACWPPSGQADETALYTYTLGAGPDIVLVQLNPTVRGIFEMLGFDRLYRIYASEWEAVSSFAATEGGPGPA